MEMLCKPPLCENVVEMLEWFDLNTAFILVLEQPVPCVSLQEFCNSHNNGRLTEYLAREVLRQVAQAVRHCFSRGVLHEDLRFENILVNPETLEVKLIDFGCGKLLLLNNTAPTGAFRRTRYGT